MSRLAFVPLVLIVTGCASSSGAQRWRAPAHLVDLTHTLSPRFPYIPLRDLTFPIRITPSGKMETHGVNSNKWKLTEHKGTHIDAPNHFDTAGKSLDQIPANELIVPAVVIDFRAQTARSADALLSVADLEAWERA